MKTRHYRDLIAWQKGMELAKVVYRATECFPKSEIYGLHGQMRRAAVSVPSNIAEGHGRLSDKSLKVFLSQARGSLYELQTQTELAHGLGYLELQVAERLDNDCTELTRILNGLLRSLTPDRETETANSPYR